MQRFRPLTLLLIALVGCSFFSLRSQVENSIDFQHIRDEMPQNSATVLFEDSYGFLWAGTPSGITKYNGTNFERFDKQQDSLTNGYINILFEEKSNIYIGTNQGLNVYDRSLNQVAPFKFKDSAKDLQYRYIRALYKNDSLLYLGTFANGIYKYNINTGSVKEFAVNQSLMVDNAADNLVVKIAPLPGKRILVVSSFRVYVMDLELNVLKDYHSEDFLNAAIQTNVNRFLIGTDKGSVIQLEVQANSELQMATRNISPGFPVLSLAKDSNSSVWVGTENNGLYVYSEKSDTVKHFKSNSLSDSSISSNSIWSLLETKDKVMWLSSYKQGLSFYDPQYYKFEHIIAKPFSSNTLSNPIVNCFSEDINGNLWIGTDGGGLNYWNRKTGSFTSYSLDENNFGSNVVLSLLQLDRDMLWAGTWSNGIVMFNTEDKTFSQWDTTNSFLRSNNISDLKKDSKGRIWIVNLFGGIQLYDPATNKHQNISLTSELDGTEVHTVFKIMEDLDGNMWVGTQTSGIFKLQENSQGWSVTNYYNVAEKRKLSNDFVNTILQDAEGTIWVATQNGLNKYNKESDSFSIITKLNDINYDVIKAILDDTNGNLWLSTDGGILQFNRATGNTLSYNKNDGLQSKEFNAGASMITSQGEFVFGGVNGFNIFRPEEIKKRTDKPEIFISGLSVFNKPVLPNDDFDILDKDISVLDSVELNYDHYVVNFSFNALTFRHSEAVEYAYFLEGFEKDWNYVGNNTSATYTNLNPGAYTLRIKSTNSDGVWVSNEKQLYLVVKPPYWETTIFQLLALTLVLLSISFIYFWKMRRIKNRQRELEGIIKKRTKQLQKQKDKLVEVANELSIKNEEIQRFTFAVTHDLKGPLNNIKSITNLIPNEVEGNNASNLKKYLGLIDVCYDIMNKLITDVSKIAKLGRIENNYEVLDTNEIITLARTINSEHLETGQVAMQIDDALPNIYGDRNRMIQVFSNFIDNAVKYMENQSRPEIHIRYESNGDYNSFLIQDNGSGMNAEALNKLFTPFERFHSKVKGTGLGLYMIRQIAISHGGQITATSEGEGEGTLFQLILPKAHIAQDIILNNKSFKEL